MLYTIAVGAFSLLAVVAFVSFVASLLKTPRSFKDVHCVITGGSKGIGKELAKQLVGEGAKVTIIARNKTGLDKAAQEIRSRMSGAMIHVEAADCTDMDSMKQAIATAEQSFGPVGCLITCAGMALPGYFLDQSATIFKRQMEINYLGTVHAVKAVVGSMVQRKDGIICMVSSGIMAGGFLGYSSYAPTKLAVRGLADSLRNELLGFNIDVCICYPPDTETDGFVQENKTKPKETLLISPPEVHSAQKVASGILRGMKKGVYHIPGPDVVQNLIISSTASTSRRINTVVEALIICPLISIVLQLFRVFHMDPIARKYGKEHKHE